MNLADVVWAASTPEAKRFLAEWARAMASSLASGDTSGDAQLLKKLFEAGSPKTGDWTIFQLQQVHSGLVQLPEAECHVIQ